MQWSKEPVVNAALAKSNSQTAPQSNRQSTMVGYGQGLMDASNKLNSMKGVGADASHPLRKSQGSKMQKYSYHATKPNAPNEKIGEYVTKEVRQTQA